MTIFVKGGVYYNEKYILRNLIGLYYNFKLNLIWKLFFLQKLLFCVIPYIETKLRFLIFFLIFMIIIFFLILICFEKLIAVCYSSENI